MREIMKKMRGKKRKQKEIKAQQKSNKIESKTIATMDTRDGPQQIKKNLMNFYTGLMAIGKVPTIPNVTVEWCRGKLKPMWLPIKAHRFTACRSKVF